jgi:hypothetical protein
LILLARVEIYQNLISEYAKVFFSFVFAFGRTTLWKTVIGWFRMLIVADWSRRAFIMRFSLGPVSRSTETVEEPCPLSFLSNIGKLLPWNGLSPCAKEWTETRIRLQAQASEYKRITGFDLTDFD